MNLGNPAEWRDCKLSEVETVRLRLLNPKQKPSVFDDSDQENPNGFLHKQWRRRDLLGMPFSWEDDIILIIPASAAERVMEEFNEYKVGFETV